MGGREERGKGVEFADLFGRARKAGRLGWVERRRAESRTRFKRKVLRVNGAEVMPRPQQQQPSSARVLAHSLARFFRSLLFAPVLPLPRNNRREKKGGERGREARFLSPRGFSPLLKHTLSSCLLLLSLSLYRCLPRLHHSSSISLRRTCHVLTCSLVAALFLPQRCLLSHPRDGPIFSSYSSYHEQSLTSASNASCRRTSSTDSCLLFVCMRGHVYLY